MRKLVFVMACLLAACGSDGDPNAVSTTSTIGTMFGDTAAVSAKTADGWITKWCQVEPGATKTQMRDLMGAPSSEFDDQDQWEAFDVSFTAFYDTSSTTYILQTDSETWSPANKAKLACADVRRSDGTSVDY